MTMEDAFAASLTPGKNGAMATIECHTVGYYGAIVSAYIGASPPRLEAFPVSWMNQTALRWNTPSQAWRGMSGREMPTIIVSPSTRAPSAYVADSQPRSDRVINRPPVALSSEPGSRQVRSQAPIPAATAVTTTQPARNVASPQPR